MRQPKHHRKLNVYCKSCKWPRKNKTPKRKRLWICNSKWSPQLINLNLNHEKIEDMNLSHEDMNLSYGKCPFRVKFGIKIEKFEEFFPKNVANKLSRSLKWCFVIYTFFCLNFRALKNAQAKLKAQQQQQQQQQEVSFKFWFWICCQMRLMLINLNVFFLFFFRIRLDRLDSWKASSKQSQAIINCLRQ